MAGGPFFEPPYPPLSVQAFGPSMEFRVTVHHNGGTVVIGHHADLGLQKIPTLVVPTSPWVDVAMHGLPGRFVESLSGTYEITPALVVQLLEGMGAVAKGSPLRLLACHAGEAPSGGIPIAQQLATLWNGPVLAANGILRVLAKSIKVDLVDWTTDAMGMMLPNVTSAGQGTWKTFRP